MKIIAIIPARGGSKRIPLKNLIMLGDKPLLAYPIMLSKSIDIIDRVIVSSDHKEIIDKALEFGAEAPFVRPAEISDNLPCEFVTEHAIRFLIEQENYTPDIVITLTPATPFTQKEELKKAIDLLCDHDDWDSVISVRKANEFPEWLVKYKPGEPVTTYLGNPLDGKYNVSQNLIRYHYPAGAFFVNRVKSFLKRPSLYGDKWGALELDPETHVDIDEPIDLEYAKILLKRI